MNKIQEIYKTLYDVYGSQGWWPFIHYDGNRYHPSDYNFPRDENEVFEVCLGSILTQNTTFTSVVKSLHNLNDMRCLNHQAIKNMPFEELKLAIKSSGYNNQKSDYILGFIGFFENLNGKTPSRDELLHVRGIGEETADSILLFAYNKPQFKVDAYTKRLLFHLKFITKKTLTIKLKELEKLKLINREVFAEVPPRVEYSLSEYGEDLRPVIDEIPVWSQKYMSVFGIKIDEENTKGGNDV